MKKLLAGYRQFRAERWPKEHALYEALARGQTPRLLIIACADSRVDPSTIFNAGPGELFVVRNVAALAPPYAADEGLHGTSAAIEFAVKKLNVHSILVLGHAACGGVSAALDDDQLDETEFLRPWIALMAPARARCLACDDPQTALEREAIKLSLDRLMTFPFVAERVRAGALSLEGARFGIENGLLELYDREVDAFVVLG
ncbi:MAG: carbonic anhydrase [Caulobacterales bacterium]|jgi:carbonic anhydrase